VCVCVLSFSWLSWQVDRIFIVLLAGGRAVTSFRREFRRLYLSSRPVAPRFHAASASAPPTGYASRLGLLSQKNPCDLALESVLKRRRRGADGNEDPAAGETETQTESTEPVHVALSKLEVERDRAAAYVMSLEQISQPGQPGQAEPPSQWRTEFPQYLALSDAHAGAAERQQTQQQRWRGGAPQAHATPNSTFSHAYKQNGGNDTQLACGKQTTAAAAAAAAVAAGGLVYQHYRNGRNAMEYGTTASNVETLRRVQRSESQNANGSRPATASRLLGRAQSLLQKTHQVQGTAAQGLLYNHTQSQRKWLGLAQLSPQGGGGGGGGGACRTQSPNKLPWPGAGAAPRDVKSFSPDPRTDLKSQAKPQQLQESGFSAGVPGTKATPQDPQSYASQQLGRSQRLHWISQLHARPLASGATGNGMAGGGRRMVGELSQRDNGESGASGTKSRGPGNGVPGRPAVLATLNARLKENESRGHQRP